LLRRRSDQQSHPLYPVGNVGAGRRANDLASSMRRLSSEAELRRTWTQKPLHDLSEPMPGSRVDEGDLGGRTAGLVAFNALGKSALRRHHSLGPDRQADGARRAAASPSGLASPSNQPRRALSLSSKSHLHRLHSAATTSQLQPTQQQRQQPHQQLSHGRNRDTSSLPFSRVRKLAGALKREGSLLAAMSLLSNEANIQETQFASPSTSLGVIGVISPPSLSTTHLSSLNMAALGGGEQIRKHQTPGQSPHLDPSSSVSSPCSGTPPSTISFMQTSARPPGPGLGRGVPGREMGEAISTVPCHDSCLQCQLNDRATEASPVTSSFPWAPLTAQINKTRDIADLCKANAHAMEQWGSSRGKELAKLWSMLFISASACLDALCVEATRLVTATVAGRTSIALSLEALRPWRDGPLGRPLVEKLLTVYEKEGDVQTLATIVCVLDVEHPGSLLQESKRAEYDRYLRAYAELLYRWGALETRAEVLKRLSVSSSASTSTEESKCLSMRPQDMVVALRCEGCGSLDGGVDAGTGVCQKCKMFAFRCVICQLAVRGQSMFCLNCSHGGHTPHVWDWFIENDMCASGCGCRCVFGQSVEIQCK
jgi:hypothetical protein